MKKDELRSLWRASVALKGMSCCIEKGMSYFRRGGDVLEKDKKRKRFFKISCVALEWRQKIMICFTRAKVALEEYQLL